MVIGAGPSGLMSAETLASRGISVTVYDQMPSPGRKFLMAGRGGLNLTHTEPASAFLPRYELSGPRLQPAINDFSPQALRAWCEALGQPTFVGSSGRVFPVAMKASPLLRAWLKRLEGLAVTFRFRHRWTGWTDGGGLRFDGQAGPSVVNAPATILATGGASWPRLGADGRWAKILSEAGLSIAPLKPSNCGFSADWSPIFFQKFEGHPLKGVALAFAGRTARGDMVVTQRGLEGGAIYALSAPLRDALLDGRPTEVSVALRPDSSQTDVVARLGRRAPKQSLATALKRALNLAPAAIGLLHEFAHGAGENLSSWSAERLAHLINAVPIRLTGVAPLDRAISTAGGLAFGEIDETFMLRRRPGTFVAGEMLDWEAPTGGYLLQACFATGVAAGEGAARWLARGF